MPGTVTMRVDVGRVASAGRQRFYVNSLGVGFNGMVTIEGTPVKTGAISFVPNNRKASMAGGEITDGQYSAEVAPGVAKVEIRVPKVVGQKKLYNTPNSPVRPIMAEVLPAKYNDETELTLDVQLGENKHDFALKMQ